MPRAQLSTPPYVAPEQVSPRRFDAPRMPDGHWAVDPSEWGSGPAHERSARVLESALCLLGSLSADVREMQRRFIEHQIVAQECAPDGPVMKRMERDLIIDALRVCQGSQKHAAQRLGITERVMSYRVRKLGISVLQLKRSLQGVQA